MRAGLPVLFGVFVGFCAGQTPVTVQYKDLPGVAVYNNGYLLSWDSPQYTRVALYDRNAKLVYIAPERRDDGSSQYMGAVDSDGAVAGAYVWGRRPPEGRIDLLDPFGNVSRTIKTGSYIPRQVVFAPDHTLWTVGYNAKTFGTDDFNVLHHYARTGEELGQALPRSQVSGDVNYPIIDVVRGGQLLYAAKDRIGWNAALHVGSRTWVEVSFSGTLLAKYDLELTGGVHLMPVAMTADGTVYARIVTRDAHLTGYAILDRPQATWRKVAGDPAGILIGSDEDNVAFLEPDPNSAILILHLIASSGLRSEAIQDAAAVR